MKPSFYNIMIEHNGKTFIYNTLNTTIAEVNPIMTSLLEKPFINTDEMAPFVQNFIKEMTKGGFLLEDHVDELKILKHISNQAKYSRNSLNLVIAPTLACNFNCFYCYEQGVDATHGMSGMMSKEVCQALVQFVSERLDNVKNLNITWYGGEPMLAGDIIFDLSEKFIALADARNIKYSANMITNGYMIGKHAELIKALKIARIEVFQITLDGPPKIHNQRRTLKNDPATGTFHTILHGVKELHRNNCKLHVRINLDYNNKDGAVKLAEIFKAEGLMDVNLFIAEVMADTPGCEHFEEECLNSEDLFQTAMQFRTARFENRTDQKGQLHRLALGCDANSINSFVIDPDGDLYKCWHDLGYKGTSCGSVMNKDTDRAKRFHEIDYITWEPFEIDNCRNCKALPICMGGCLYQRFHRKNIERACSGQAFMDHVVQYIKEYVM